MLSNKLSDLLSEVTISGDNGNWTHLTDSGSPHKWCINSNKLEKFWTEYCALNHNKSEDLFLHERCTDSMPVIAIFHFAFHVDEKHEIEEFFSDKAIYALIYCFQKSILDLYQPPATISEEDDFIVCAVRESEQWLVDKRMNIKLMLQFPHVRIPASQQMTILRPRVLELIKQCNIKRFMTREPEDPWETIFINTSVVEPVPMIGSRRARDGKCMMFKFLVGKINETHFDESEADEVMELDICDVLHREDHCNVKQGLVSIDKLTIEGVENKGDIDEGAYWLPLLLSIHYFTGVARERNSSFKENKIIGNITENMTELEHADILISIMNCPKRFSEPCFWLDIGKALHHCSEGAPEGLQKWRKYTEQYNSGKVDKDLAKRCESEYERFVDGPITIKTLGWYAREDSVRKYNEWQSARVKLAMERALSTAHTDVACALARQYWLFFIYSPENKAWYKFSGHKWKAAGSGGMDLSREISGDFVRLFERYRMELSEKVNRCNDEDGRTRYENNIKKVTALIAKLKTVSYKRQIMAEAAEFFARENIDRIMDMNEYIMCARDCVIDVSSGRAFTRDGKPEDFLSRTGYASVGTMRYSEQHPLVMELNAWIDKVFPDPDLRLHFWKFAASCIKGLNSDKILPVFTGEGNNSKSMIIKLFEAAFGEYCIKFPGSLLTGQRTQSSGPTPEIARAASAKIGVIQELGPNEKMQAGRIKELTGGDSFYARALNQNGGDIKAVFKLICMFNKIPPVPYSDAAVRNRFCIFPFISTWSRSAPEDEKEQMRTRVFKMDPHFERRIPDLAGPFLWLLVTKYYAAYMKEGLTKPDAIRQYTDKYWTNQDFYLRFQWDCVENVFKAGIEGKNVDDINTDAVVPVDEMYEAFKVWFRRNFPDSRIPNSQTVAEALDEKLGNRGKIGWHGVRLKDDNIPSQVGKGHKAR